MLAAVMVFCCIHIVNIYFLECRHCADRYGYEEAWRCFFAQYAWRHVRLNTLYHTYLYEYANLAYDTATSADYELFRRELTHVLENGVHHTIFPFQPQHHNSSVTGTARTSSRGMLCCQGMVADSGHTLGQADGNTHWLPNVRRPLNVFAPACCARANLKGQQIIPGRHARLLMQCFGLSVSAHVQSDIMLSIYLHED